MDLAQLARDPILERASGGEFKDRGIYIQGLCKGFGLYCPFEEPLERFRAKEGLSWFTLGNLS